MKQLFRLGLLALVPSVFVFASGETAPTLYERIEAKLSARTDLASLGQPSPELKNIEWMLGAWTVDSTVFATRTAPARHAQGTSIITQAVNNCWIQNLDSYPDGWQDISYLTFNAVTRRWVTLAIDASGNAVQITAEGWHGDKLAFEATVEVVGEKVTLRQTLQKISPDEFLVLNEERLADGRLVGLDEYRYRRRQ